MPAMPAAARQPRSAKPAPIASVDACIDMLPEETPDPVAVA